MSWDLRIAVCVPGDDWEAGFGHSVSNMMAEFAGAVYRGGSKEIQLFSVTGSILPDVRTRLVIEAIKWKATHLLFLDTDMVFCRDLLTDLLRHNVPVVGANYPRRVVPAIPTAYRLDEAGPLYTRPGDSGLVEVSHVATGAVLIDMRVFDGIDMPWFQFDWLCDDPTKPPRIQGEDVYFCKKVRAANIPVHVDQDVSQYVRHIGELEFTHALTLADEHAMGLDIKDAA